MHGSSATLADAPLRSRPLERIQQALRWVNGTVMCAGLLSLVLFCFGQAVDRYTLKTSFDAYDQLAKVGLVWLVFSGMALGYAARENLRIDLFSRNWHGGWLRLREIVFESLVLLVCVLVHVKGWDVVEVAGMQPIIGTPLTNAFSYSAILVGTFSIAFTCIVRLALLTRILRS